MPLKRTTDTASATGSTATFGRGQFSMSVVSMPKVMTSLKSTSILACNLPSFELLSLLFGLPKPSPPSSTGMTLQLLKMGNSSPSSISVTRISPNQSGRVGPLRMFVKEVNTASSWRASALNCAIVWAISTLNQSKLSGWWPFTL